MVENIAFFDPNGFILIRNKSKKREMRAVVVKLSVLLLFFFSCCCCWVPVQCVELKCCLGSEAAFINPDDAGKGRGLLWQRVQPGRRRKTQTV